MRTGTSYLSAMVLIVLTLAGCSGGVGDLQDWAREQRRQAVPKITPLSEPKSYVPLPYTQGTAADPFGLDRLTKFFINESGGTTLCKQEQNRRKEPLEAYPLDSMSMVGSLERGGQRVALVKVDKLLYQVRVGTYLGQNYGLVTNLSEHEVTLREIIENGTGECIERTAALQLQESKK